ncbi:DEAD/DEAH box helicase family protein [Nocardia asiatica]|uniref:AAA family ATPase n=1 Tax=Nocardia asiatica TaxID=209252 RepID=UPI002455801A|nr:AAA family ATPase [Nocardia asiatica]
MTAIKTRKPTGAVPWPLILIEGGEKAGKSWAAAEFTADDRIGQAYWIDLGEGSADEYAAIPGANYLVVDHDGTWADIVGQIAAIRQEAKRANDAGGKPVVLIIDSMTAEWDMLKDWATARAVTSNYAKRILARDPNAEIKPDNRLWNDANSRHAHLMRMLMTFPGIVVMTARGKEVAAMGDDGKPVAGQKDYRVEGQKGLAFDASAWVRLSRDEPPRVIGARSVAHGLRPGVDKPKPAPDFTIAWLIFEVLKCDPRTATVRDLRKLDTTPEQAPADQDQAAPDAPSVADRARNAVSRKRASELTQEQLDEKAEQMRKAIVNANSREELQGIWKEAATLGPDWCVVIRSEAQVRVAQLEEAAASIPDAAAENAEPPSDRVA